MLDPAPILALDPILALPNTLGRIAPISVDWTSPTWPGGGWRVHLLAEHFDRIFAGREPTARREFLEVALGGVVYYRLAPRERL